MCVRKDAAIHGDGPGHGIDVLHANGHDAAFAVVGVDFRALGGEAERRGRKRGQCDCGPHGAATPFHARINICSDEPIRQAASGRAPAINLQVPG